MGSYAAAEVAVKAALVAGWTTTRITYENEVPADPWPPVDGSGWVLPFVHFEMETTPGQTLRGVGVPGNHLSQTQGMIRVHVFVPDGTGKETATQYAETIGELFRTKVPYAPGDGCYLRTWVPRVGKGEAAANGVSGNWWGCSMSVPFTYYHQG